MQTFGYKVVDRDARAIVPVIEEALRRDRPIEIGLYHADPEAAVVLEGLLAGANAALNTHLDHTRYHLFALHRRLPGLTRQIARSAELGASYVITHVSDQPMTPRPELAGPMLSHLLGNLELLQALAAEHGLLVLIENTFHGVSFYRRLFSAITRIGLPGLGFCFDVGHGKVWSRDTFEDWLDLLVELDRAGLPLHVHLHNNRGLSDEHLSFLEADELGIGGHDAFVGERTYLEALALLRDRAPRARKVFEVKPELALENLEFILARLHWDRAAGGVIRDAAGSCGSTSNDGP